MKLSSPSFLWLAVMGILLIGCYDPMDGCLDVLASNYEINADESCEDCCNYPSLELNFSHKVDTVNLSLDSVYTDEEIRFDRILFFVSNVMLTNEQGKRIGVEDSIRVEFLEQGALKSRSIRDDVILVDAPLQNYRVGTLIAPGQYNKVSFDIGLFQEANHIIQANLQDTTHVLFTSDSLYIDQEAGYVFNSFRIQKDTSDVNSYFLYQIAGDDKLFSFEADIELNLDRGESAKINISVDYLKWINGINFTYDSDEVVQQKLLTNLENVLSIN